MSPFDFPADGGEGGPTGGDDLVITTVNSLNRIAGGTIRLIENAPDTRAYLVETYVVCETASGAGFPDLSLSLAWQDGLNPSPATQSILADPGSAPLPRSLAAVGRAKGHALVVVSAGNNLDLIDFVNNPAGSPRWHVITNVIHLGPVA